MSQCRHTRRQPSPVIQFFSPSPERDMANIRERIDGSGKKSYQAQVRIKGRPPQSKTFPTKTLAKRWAEQTETGIRTGEIKLSQDGKHLLSDLIAYYRKNVLPHKAKVGADDEAPLAFWGAHLGTYFLEAITTPIVASAYNKLAEQKLGSGQPRKPATLVRYLMVLSSVFSTGINVTKWCRENPVDGVIKPKVDNDRVRYLTDIEQKRLLDACKTSQNPDLHFIVLLAMSTGMRKSELAKLRWGDITLFEKDRYAKGLLTNTKSKKSKAVSRSLMISGPAYSVLLARFKSVQKSLDIRTMLLFPSDNDANKPNDFRSAWRTALARSAIKDFKYHDLRHTAASYLAMEGSSLLSIKAVLGHKTTRMSERYAHLTVEQTDQEIRKMNSKRINRR